MSRWVFMISPANVSSSGRAIRYSAAITLFGNPSKAYFATVPAHKRIILKKAVNREGAKGNKGKIEFQTFTFWVNAGFKIYVYF
jgi:hypothetical protein